MALTERNFSTGQGRLTHGPQAGALVERTLEFVRSELPIWRDRADRRPESAEEKLNAQLCKHLNSAARRDLPAVQFHHEEKQTKGRRVDISAGLSEGGFIGTTYHSIDEPFIVFEGKRLPSPGGKLREREYVTGGEARTGGMQRFKLALHGADVATAVMIGYIQKGTVSQWQERINRWIGDLADSLPLGEERWTREEQLEGFTPDQTLRIAIASSLHDRAGSFSGTIRVMHYWVEMTRH